MGRAFKLLRIILLPVKKRLTEKQNSFNVLLTTIQVILFLSVIVFENHLWLFQDIWFMSQYLQVLFQR